MSFDYIRNHYKMPWLRRGLLVQMDGRTGRVTVGKGPYVGVRFSDEQHSSHIHPQWNVVYHDEDGKVLADYR